MMRIRLSLLFLALLLTGMLLTLVTLPTSAQQMPTLVTNTPQPTLSVPIAASEQYALRSLQESDLLNLLYDGLNRLAADDDGAREIVTLTLYELSQRFPGAPSDVTERETLLNAMLAAPRGSVDMRALVRPYIETLLNSERPDFTERGALSRAGFTIEVFPANLNGDEQPDAVIHTVSRGVLYEDYTMATIDAQGVYRLYNSVPSLPVAPLGDVRSIMLERIEDVTGDSIDEMVLLVTNDDNVNPIEMLIYGVRGQAITLTEPNSTIRFGRLLGFPSDSTQISAAEYRLESEAWGCISERSVSWSWVGNFFRFTAAGDNMGYVQQNSLACALFQTEPLFSLEPREAITRVQNALAGFPFGDPGTNRAGMVLAMLYELEGSRDIAVGQAQQFLSFASEDAWLMTQAQTLIDAASNPEATSLDVCVAMQQASPHGACNIDEVLQRMFASEPLRRDRPVIEQLEERGLSVLEATEISEVGFAPRTVVRLSLEGASWWAFAATTREFYTAEAQAVPPAGFETNFLPPTQAEPSREVYQALIERNDITGTLALLENVERSAGFAPLSAEGMYIRALSYDLLVDRENARQHYFNLWAAYPTTIWGQFAAAHLELR